MNISSVTNSSSISQLQSLQSISTTAPSAVSTDGWKASDQTSVSKMGKLTSQLQDLEKTDPDRRSVGRQPKAGGHHHHHGGGAKVQAYAQSSSDPMSGVESVMEQARSGASATASA